MRISFATRKLQRQISNEAAMTKAFGACARPLKLRLSLLRAASCLADVPHTKPARLHELGNDRAGQLAVDLKENWRLILEPDHDPVPKRGDDGIDREAATDIRIIGVEDYP